MTANAVLQRVDEQGWRRGFANLLWRENREWWPSRRWWMRTLLWVAILNAITAGVLWSPQAESSAPATAPSSGKVNITTSDPLTNGLVTFVMLGGLIVTVSVIVGMQGAIIDEKKTGTAAWILSKPVARSAFVMSKLIAHGLSLLVRMVVLPSIVVFILLTVRVGTAPALIPFLVGVSLLGLNLLFYLALSVMLGTLFEERGPVIGLPLLVVLGAQLLIGVVPGLAQFTPWSLIIEAGDTHSLAMQAMLGQALPTVIPIIATVIWIVVFAIVAIRRFEREEF